jgi:hypothetical protein
MLKRCLILVGWIFSCLSLQAQEQEQENIDYVYAQEYLFGVRKSTDGGFISGFTFKYGNKVSENIFQTYGVELVNVKHPKEIKYINLRTGGTFIWQKANYLYALRFQYGREQVFFKKAQDRGVQVSGMLAVGPSLGFVAPYYIQYRTNGSSYESVHFDPYVHTNQSRIGGVGYPLQGIFESKMKLGANLKASVFFELGHSMDDVIGFEAGFLVDGYLGKEIPLMPAVENKHVFPSAFITFFYGFRR